MDTTTTAATRTNLFALAWDHETASFTLLASAWLIALVLLIFALAIIWRWWSGGLSTKKFEIDQAEIGVGKSKLSFRPNYRDKQVAYAIWVELSTRKIGLEIDFEHDVVDEIYDSWFNFFTVTRELIKEIPVNQVRHASTQAIIKLSIEVLNEGLRPHLTRWQARFRLWYDRRLQRYKDGEEGEVLHPQQMQAEFPQFDELKSDMKRVNDSLIKYRAKMRQLVLTD